MRFSKIAVCLLALLLTFPASAGLRRFVGGTASSGGAIALTRTLNQPSGTSTPASAFWTMGYPFKTGDLPSGMIPQCTLGGVSVRCTLEARTTHGHSDGSISWGQLYVDYSGQTITPGSSKTLALTAVAGSYNDTTTRTNADWEGLADTVTLANLNNVDSAFTGSIVPASTSGGLLIAPLYEATNINPGDIITGSGVTAGTTVTGVFNSDPSCTTGNCWQLNNSQTISSEALTATQPTGSGTGYAQPSGTWTCPFDGSGADSIETYATSPIGLHVQVTANCANGGTTNVCLQAVMDYWVTQTSTGTLGPIASLGPQVRNMQMFKSQCPTKYNYDLTWLRNGVQQRQYLQVPNIAMTAAQALRPDGLYDWTADDPAIWVSQDCSLVRKTGLIPPFPDAVCGPSSTYVGANQYLPTVAITGISAGTFSATSGTLGNLASTGFPSPTGIQFTWASQPTGLNLNTVYWYCFVSSSTFKIYDTYADALACGSTGQIVPSTSGSSVVAQLAVAPMHPAQFDPSEGDPGARPDIAITAEWGAAYLGYNSQAGEKMSRVSANAMWGIPNWVTNDATGLPPCLLDAPGTPGSGDAGCPSSGLGTAKPNTAWAPTQGNPSSDINGGNPSSGGTGVWFPEGSHFLGNVAYVPWLLEGGPMMRDLLLYNANRAIANRSFIPNRNIQIGGTGSTYYGMVLAWDVGSARGAAWSFRDLGIGAFAAPQGSPLETYYQNALESSILAQNAYWTYKGAGISGLGLSFEDDNYGNASLEASFGSNFMQTYVVGSVNFVALLDGANVSGLNTMADQTEVWLSALFNTNCPFWSAAFNIGWSLSDNGAATPGTYIPNNIADLGYDDQETQYTFTSGSPWIVPASTVGQPAPAPWGPGFPVAVGDRYWPLNFTSDSGSASPAPSPFVDGQFPPYFVVGEAGSGTCPGGATECFEVSTTALGSPIVSSGNAVVGGIMRPDGQSCPAASAGIYGDNSLGAGDSYTTEKMFALAMGAIRGNSSAAAAWAIANARFVAASGSFANQMMFSSQPTQ